MNFTMDKKILVFVLLALMLVIPMVSAFNFDNVKEFDKNKGNSGRGVATIKNMWGMGGTLAEIELIDNTDTCLSNCYAIGTIDLKKDGYLMEGLRFKKKNKETGEWGIGGIKDYHIYIKTNEEEIKVDDYERVCTPKGKPTANGTQAETCEMVKTGFHWETQDEWEEYHGQYLDKGKYTWKITGKKYKEQEVDWLASFFGEEISEWAVWGYVDPVLYYKFNEGGTSDAIDSSPYGRDATNIGGMLHNTGLLGNATQFAGSGKYFNVSFDALGITTGDFTISFWYNTSDGFGSGHTSIMGTGTLYDDTIGWKVWGTGGNMKFGVRDVHAEAMDTLEIPVNNDNSWVLLTIVRNSTALCMWQNATAPTCIVPEGDDMTAGTNDLHIGDSWGTAVMTGLIDDLAIYDVAFTQEDIDAIYNSGTGKQHDANGIDVTLEAPANNSIEISNEVDFTCSASALGTTPLINVTLWNNVSGTFEPVETQVAGITDYLAYWKFDNLDPLIDEAGTHNGTQGDGSLSLTADRNGNPNSAIWRNGGATGSTYNTIANENDFMEQTAGTWSFWTNVTTRSTGSIGFMQVDGTGYTDDLQIQVDATGSDELHVYADTEKISTPLIFTGANLGVWKMITLTWDATGIWVYIDGTLVNSSSTTNTQSGNIGTDNFFMGYVNDGGDDFVMDDVVILDYALSQTQITALYEGGILENVLTTNNTFTDTISGSTLWNCEVCNDEDWCFFASENWTVSLDPNPPNLTISYPINASVIPFTTNLTINWTITDENLNDTSCYINYNSVSYNVSCSQNGTILPANVSATSFTFNSTDLVGNFISAETFWDWYTYTQTASEVSVSEGDSITFDLAVNYTDIPSTTATLYFNNTAYSPDTSVANDDSYYFTKTITTASGDGNETGLPQEWYWNYTISGIATGVETETETIPVYSVGIDDCSSYGEVILNITAYDEEAITLLPANETTIEVDLTISSLTNDEISWNYFNTWSNNTAQVCIPSGILNSSIYRIDFTISYVSTDHAQEFFYLDNGTLSNNTIFGSYTAKNLGLYDLATADSSSFLFNYYDTDGLPVKDIIIHTFRKYVGEGVYREVERSKADNNGQTHVHLVEEDVIYYFMVTLNRERLYTSGTYNAKCISTPCTITLEASEDLDAFPTDFDLIDGGSYSLSQDSTTREIEMAFSLSSPAEMNLTVYRYESDGSYTAIVGDSLSSTSGTITVTVPQSAGNVSFFTAVYKDDEFIKSSWIDFQEDASTYFGTTLSLFLVAIIVLALGLMAISKGGAVIIFMILGLVISGFLGLVNFPTSLGVNIIMYIICAGAILLYKLTKGRNE